MKKFTMLFLTLAVATANMPAVAMMSNLTRMARQVADVATDGAFSETQTSVTAPVQELSAADRALIETPELDNLVIAANKAKKLQVLKYAAAGTATAVTTGAAVAAALAYMYPQTACETLANYGFTPNVCAAYLAQPTFWQQILAYLGF